MSATHESLTLVTDRESMINRMMSTLKRWHDETHAGPFVYCDQQPCHAAQVVVSGRDTVLKCVYCNHGAAEVCELCALDICTHD